MRKSANFNLKMVLVFIVANIIKTHLLTQSNSKEFYEKAKKKLSLIMKCYLNHQLQYSFYTPSFGKILLEKRLTIFVQIIQVQIFLKEFLFQSCFLNQTSLLPIF